MKEIKAYVRCHMVDAVLDALAMLPDTPGVTVVAVQGFGHPKNSSPPRLIDRTKLEIVVPDAQVQVVVDCIVQHAHTGSFGDGKVFVSTVDDAVRIRNGETGEEAV